MWKNLTKIFASLYNWELSQINYTNVIAITQFLLRQAVKGLKIGKAATPTGAVSEIMKSSDGFGISWMTNMLNNIVNEGCITDAWRILSTLVPVYNGNETHLCAIHTEQLSYWSSRWRCQRECWKRGPYVRCQLMAWVWFHAWQRTSDAIFTMRQVHERPLKEGN